MTRHLQAPTDAAGRLPTLQDNPQTLVRQLSDTPKQTLVPKVSGTAWKCKGILSIVFLGVIRYVWRCFRCWGVVLSVSECWVHAEYSMPRANPPFWHNPERLVFSSPGSFETLKYQTSQCTVSKNGWVLPIYVIFRPVRKKLQFTVLLDHPVV